MASPHNPHNPPRLLRPVPLPGEASGPAPHGGSAAPPAPARRLTLTPAGSIQLEPTYWLWEGRIPAGALTLGPGREGIGKSLFCAWLTAQVTTGALPGIHHGRPRGVVYAATEDSWSRTIAGRLHAAEADLTRVFRIEVAGLDGSPVPLSLPTDCDRLAEQIPAYDIGLVVLDPLISAVDSRINVNSEELRGALEPLARLADTTGVAIFGLAHFNKASGTDALSRVTGSRAFTAVARAAVAFARDPAAEDGSCVISQVKNNLGRLDVPSLRYRVDSVTLDTAIGPGTWGRLVMLGETDSHVEALLNDADTGEEDRSERDAAAAWLEDYLTSQGGSAQGSEVKKAGRAAGIAERTLARARRTLSVTIIAEGFPRTTVWRLP